MTRQICAVVGPELRDRCVLEPFKCRRAPRRDTWLLPPLCCLGRVAGWSCAVEELREEVAALVDRPARDASLDRAVVLGVSQRSSQCVAALV